MEFYKPRKIIENQKIDFQLTFSQVNATKEELQESLKKRKEIEVQQNDTQYKKEKIEDICDEVRSNKIDTTMVDLLEKNNIMNEEVSALKRKHKIQSVRLCEFIEKKG